MIPIPLPCNRGFSGLAEKSIKDRGIDIFFHGQIFNWHRKTMYKNLEIFKFNNLNINFQLGYSKCFNTGLSLEEYSKTLSNTKIAICPGGNNLETFRFTEAAKCGCVIIGESKLNYWFYDKNPQVTIERWEDIHWLLPRVLADVGKCQKISDNTKRYYHYRLSEQAVTEYILSAIKVKLT